MSRQGDPFADQASANYNDPSPPPPPPKSKHHSHNKSIPINHPGNNHLDITQAVRDTVTVQGKSDRTERNPISRSHTQAHTDATRPIPSRRTVSHESSNMSGDKSKSKGRKKGSQHADVIDRLDFTGVGPMFHHDGPFDACAPSRNKHRTKAPMAAWSPTGLGSVDPRAGNDGPYPSPAAAGATTFSYEHEAPRRKVDAIAEAWGIHEPEPFEEFSAGGGKHIDTPSSSIYHGRGGRAAASGAAADGSSRRDRVNGAGEERARPRDKPRHAVPPPMPIFVPEGEVPSDQPMPSPPLGSPGAGAPKRTKSLMHRIRRLRDSPNVPLNNGGYESGSPTSPTADGYRPGHRANNSSMAVPRSSGGAEPASPLSDSSDFVYIDNSTPRRRADDAAPPSAHHDPSNNYNRYDMGKELPKSPGTPSDQEFYAYVNSKNKNNYFEGVSPGGGAGVGRRGSLLMRAKGFVRGNK